MKKRLCDQTGKTAIILFSMAGICAAMTRTIPTPGTLSHVEGQVWIGGKKQTPRSVGCSLIKPSQTLTTGAGNAELALTPGAYLSVASNSAVTMVARDLKDTEFRLEKGSASVQVDKWFKNNDLHIVVGKGTARMTEDGSYYFNATPPSAVVFYGKARVALGDQRLLLKEGYEARLIVGEPLKAQKVDRKCLKSDPRWRTEYLRSAGGSQADTQFPDTLGLNSGSHAGQG
jgi:hypothetical protein